MGEIFSADYNNCDEFAYQLRYLNTLLKINSFNSRVNQIEVKGQTAYRTAEGYVKKDDVKNDFWSVKVYEKITDSRDIDYFSILPNQVVCEPISVDWKEQRSIITKIKEYLDTQEVRYNVFVSGGRKLSLEFFFSVEKGCPINVDKIREILWKDILEKTEIKQEQMDDTSIFWKHEKEDNLHLIVGGRHMNYGYKTLIKEIPKDQPEKVTSLEKVKYPEKIELFDVSEEIIKSKIGREGYIQEKEKLKDVELVKKAFLLKDIDPDELSYKWDNHQKQKIYNTFDDSFRGCKTMVNYINRIKMDSGTSKLNGLGKESKKDVLSVLIRIILSRDGVLLKNNLEPYIFCDGKVRSINHIAPYLNSKYGYDIIKSDKEHLKNYILSSGKETELQKLFHFDGAESILYISDRKGGVFVLDGDRVEHRENGYKGNFFLEGGEPLTYLQKEERVVIKQSEIIGLNEMIKLENNFWNLIACRSNYSFSTSLDPEEQRDQLLFYFYSLIYKKE